MNADADNKATITVPTETHQGLTGPRCGPTRARRREIAQRLLGASGLQMHTAAAVLSQVQSRPQTQRRIVIGLGSRDVAGGTTRHLRPAVTRRRRAAARRHSGRRAEPDWPGDRV